MELINLSINLYLVDNYKTGVYKYCESIKEARKVFMQYCKENKTNRTVNRV